MTSGKSEAQNSSTHSTIKFCRGAFKFPEVVYSWIPWLNQLIGIYLRIDKSYIILLKITNFPNAQITAA